MINKESVAIYLAGVIQGITLVAFPAASTIFTNSDSFNFSNTEYGSLFIPQAILSIIAAASSPKLSKHFGSKFVFMLGLAANLISMALLASSAFVMENKDISYLMLLFATGFLGLGFGLLVPTLNAMAALLYPKRVDSILLFLNALLGIGTALAPVFISLFVSFGFWWGLPTLLLFLLILLLAFSHALDLPGGKIDIPTKNLKVIHISGYLWLFIAFAFLYGIVETLNGNWVSIYLKNYLGINLEGQSLALASFWGMVTFGRIFFALIEKFFKERWVFQILPFICSIAFLIIASLPENVEYYAVVAFGLSGFGCSALLPLTISFGQKKLEAIAFSIPGIIISSYLLGYGVAAFGVGPLEDLTQISLRMVYVIGAIIAFILGVISLLMIQPKKMSPM